MKGIMDAEIRSECFVQKRYANVSLEVLCYDNTVDD